MRNGSSRKGQLTLQPVASIDTIILNPIFVGIRKRIQGDKD
jgi:hypothetical protein